MEKIHKAQVFKTVVLFAFLLMIPFISSSLRTSYLYFILNLLILVLAIESGVLTATSDPADEKKEALLHPYVASPLHPNYSNLNSFTVRSKGSNGFDECNTTGFPVLEKKMKKPTMAVAEKPTTARKVLGMAATMEKKTIKKSPSRPSLFFIGGFDDEEEEIIVQEDARSVLKVEELMKKKEEDEFFFGDEDEDDDELFARAEMFIGNFYKQLKIQREESWKRIHGIYQKAF